MFEPFKSTYPNSGSFISDGHCASVMLDAEHTGSTLEGKDVKVGIRERQQVRESKRNWHVIQLSYLTNLESRPPRDAAFVMNASEADGRNQTISRVSHVFPLEPLSLRTYRVLMSDCIAMQASVAADKRR